MSCRAPRSWSATLLASARRAALALAVTCGATAPSSAAEQPPRDPTARAEWYSSKAEEAFQAGKFSEAIKLYLDAYESAPSASILYNVAFIYDKRLKDAELAIDWYTRAAAAPDADAALVDKAKARAAALRAQLDKPPDDKKPPDEVPDEPGGAFPTGPVITLAAGGAVLATGIVFGLMASGTQSDFDAATSSTDKRDLQSTGRTQALVADLGMALGGAAVIGGVVWLVFWDDGSDAPEGSGTAVPLGAGVPGVPGLHVRPELGPGHAGLVLGGSF